jgi:DNA repair ATPase RecN
VKEETFQNKLQETIETLKDTFEKKREIPNRDNNSIDGFEGLLDTKLADIAKEIAEESVADLKDIHDMDGAFKHLFQDPNRLMKMVKSVTQKLDSKMKSGELNEEELMKEASMMMDKMKNIPGMPNMKEDKIINEAFKEVFK